HLGQLGETLREIALRIGIVGGPALAAGLAAVAAVHDAAGVENVAEGLGVGEVRADTKKSPESAAELRVRGRCRAGADHGRSQEGSSHGEVFRGFTCLSCRATGSTPAPSS